jgi:hypothetical protein
VASPLRARYAPLIASIASILRSAPMDKLFIRIESAVSLRFELRLGGSDE